MEWYESRDTEEFLANLNTDHIIQKINEFMVSNLTQKEMFIINVSFFTDVPYKDVEIGKVLWCRSNTIDAIRKKALTKIRDFITIDLKWQQFVD
jgi:DNA-directed RNA polymerase sigma subunit (sigma70/sigma32)